MDNYNYIQGRDYLKGRYECPPYDQESMRTVYHYRNLDIFRLKQVSNNYKTRATAQFEALESV